MTAARCKATTKAGTPCKAKPLKGKDVCIAHSDKKARDATGFGITGGRPRKPRVVDVVRERIEADMDRWYTVLVEASEATRTVVVGSGDNAYIEQVPDHPTRLRAFAEAMDRAYGKPVQATEVSGPDGGPIEVNDAFNDPDVRKAGRELVRRVEAARSDKPRGARSSD